MKKFQSLRIGFRLCATLIFGLIAMTNPSPEDYKQYATHYLIKFFKESICSKDSEKIKPLWQSGCKTLVELEYPYIRQIIQQTTTRHNFVLFSIYQTDLMFTPPFPSYQFGTIGIMDKFYTYELVKF